MHRRMPSLGPVLAALFVVATLSGCIVDDGSTPTSPQVAPTTDAENAYRPNMFLLDGPRPFNARVSGGAEPAILASVEDGAVWIGDTSGVRRTLNNGSSWLKLSTPAVIVADGYALAQDEAGRLYAATTSINWIDVLVYDNGFSLSRNSRLATVSGIADRPWLAGNADGEVALIYNDFPTLRTTCVRSENAGLTWLDRRPVSGGVIGGNLVYDDSNGDLHFGAGDTIYRFKGGDCLTGATSKDMFVQGIETRHQLQVDAIDGRTFMAAPSSDNDDVLLSGRSWAASEILPTTVAIEPPELRTNLFTTLTALDADTVAVAWYGSETNGNPNSRSFSGSWNVYVAIVEDFWGTPDITYWRLTDEANHVGQICMNGINCGGADDRDLLDYFMMDADLWGGLHIAYGHDGSSNNAEVRYAHIPPGSW